MTICFELRKPRVYFFAVHGNPLSFSCIVYPFYWMAVLFLTLKRCSVCLFSCFLLLLFFCFCFCFFVVVFLLLFVVVCQALLENGIVDLHSSRSGSWKDPEKMHNDKMESSNATVSIQKESGLLHHFPCSLFHATYLFWFNGNWSRIVFSSITFVQVVRSLAEMTKNIYQERFNDMQADNLYFSNLLQSSWKLWRYGLLSNMIVNAWLLSFIDFWFF